MIWHQANFFLKTYLWRFEKFAIFVVVRSVEAIKFVLFFFRSLFLQKFDSLDFLFSAVSISPSFRISVVLTCVFAKPILGCRFGLVKHLVWLYDILQFSLPSCLK